MATCPKSCLSANNKGDNEVSPGAVHRSPDIYFMANEKHRKPQL
jgi:hypothetical protein